MAWIATWKTPSPFLLGWTLFVKSTASAIRVRLFVYIFIYLYICTYFVCLATLSRLLAWVSEMRAYLPLQKTVGWSLFCCSYSLSLPPAPSRAASTSQLPYLFFCALPVSPLKLVRQPRVRAACRDREGSILKNSLFDGSSTFDPRLRLTLVLPRDTGAHAPFFREKLFLVVAGAAIL